MSDTPRTDAWEQESLVISGYEQLRKFLCDKARQLERELVDLQREHGTLKMAFYDATEEISAQTAPVSAIGERKP